MFLFNKRGHLLLQQRSYKKITFPGMHSGLLSMAQFLNHSLELSRQQVDIFFFFFFFFFSDFFWPFRQIISIGGKFHEM